MRVSDFLLNNNFEERKRVMQRKEANSAYKKNAIYTQTKKNSMLKMLEDLLSGKTEKDLFEKEKTLIDRESEQAIPSSNEMNEDSLLYTALPPEVEVKDSEEVISEIMLSSADEVAGEVEGNVNRISHVQFDFMAPEWGSKATDQNKLHKNLESMISKKTYSKAISSYAYQMQMAQNEFRLEQPLFSLIA